MFTNVSLYYQCTVDLVYRSMSICNLTPKWRLSFNFRSSLPLSLSLSSSLVVTFSLDYLPSFFSVESRCCVRTNSLNAMKLKGPLIGYGSIGRSIVVATEQIIDAYIEQHTARLDAISLISFHLIRVSLVMVNFIDQTRFHMIKQLTLRYFLHIIDLFPCFTVGAILSSFSSSSSFLSKCG